MKIETNSPQVRIPPPLMLLGAILVGAALHWLYPIPLVSAAIWRPLGVLLIVFGVMLILYCAGLFKKAETGIKPWTAASRLITTGVYKWTRNPIYLAFVIIGIGFGLTFNTPWIILMMVPLIWWLNSYVISREERYLEKTFGDDYRQFKRTTRRWI